MASDPTGSSEKVLTETSVFEPEPISSPVLYVPEKLLPQLESAILHVSEAPNPALSELDKLKSSSLPVLEEKLKPRELIADASEQQYENTIRRFISGDAPSEDIGSFLDDELIVDKSDNELVPEKAEVSTYSSITLESTDEVNTDLEPSVSELGPVGNDSGSESDSNSASDSDSCISYSEDENAEGVDELAEDDDEADAGTGPIVSKNEVTEVAPTLPKDYQVPENAPLEYVGVITSLVEQSIIIRASTSGEFRVLKEKSVLCLEDRQVLGPLFEVFGRLQAPSYRVKYNTDEELEPFKEKKGSKVYYVVAESQFVYTDSIKNLKGTDASNCHDEELPEEEQEYSDDEQELAAKQAKLRKKKKLGKSNNTEGLVSKKQSQGLGKFTSYGSNSNSTNGSKLSYHIPVPRNPPPVVLGYQGTLNYSSGSSLPEPPGIANGNAVLNRENFHGNAQGAHACIINAAKQRVYLNYSQNTYGVPFSQQRHTNYGQQAWAQSLPTQMQSTNIYPQRNQGTMGMQTMQFQNGGHANENYYSNQYYGQEVYSHQQNEQYPSQNLQNGGPIHQYGVQLRPVFNQQGFQMQQSQQPTQNQNNHHYQQNQFDQHNQQNQQNQEDNTALKQLQRLVAKTLDEERNK